MRRIMIINNEVYIHLYGNKWIKEKPDEIMKLQPPANISDKEWYKIYFIEND